MSKPRVFVFALFALLSVLASLAAAGCGKPTQDDCRKAVVNLQRIRGLETSTNAPDPEAFTRKCRATGDPATVKCIIAAKDATDLARCEPAPAAPPPAAPPPAAK